ncbi:pilus assembly protein [Jannaschia sp. Os4]|uniref:pilus assembly protein n=1 Tax=Jannaschia sp. Os4 TaxID=2807617 RepID=UPI00193936D5|nr:pilus assembly protein [Jannaschia sp. Os4]MBM2574844.1 pilus assembly protein [Jannaschia sp. Os4]
MLSSFLRSETGAVTVDWVVLTAGLVGLSLAVTGVVSVGVQNVSVRLADLLSADLVRTTFGEIGTGLGIY